MSIIDSVKLYFDAWIKRDADVLLAVFADDVIYSECYGPEYHGISQVMRWFTDWNQHGMVLQWDIHRVLESGDELCVEWYFCCEYDGVVDGFNGVSWIEFDEAGKIRNIREYQSKAEHHFPYDLPVGVCK